MVQVKSYYKIRIIFTFGFVAAILVLLFSQGSYYFARHIYLEQLNDQLVEVSRIGASQIEKRYFEFLKAGPPTSTIKDYFHSYFANLISGSQNSEIFIFDRNMNVIFHSDPNFTAGKNETKLAMNRDEILSLKNNDAFATLPFKGFDDLWYVWGICRLNDDYFFAIGQNAPRFEKIELYSNIAWYAGGFFILLTILLANYLAKSITKPIHSLVNYSNDIGKIFDEVKMPVKMKGELLILARAMEKMHSGLLANQKEKENMLAQIAHEIRNPLGGIELLASLIKEDLDNEGKNVNYPEQILKEINGLKVLISAYLNYSKPINAVPTWINLDNWILDLETSANNNNSKKQIKLNFDVKIKNVYFDPEHLKHILLNLIKNSIDSIKDDGEIKVVFETLSSNWQIVVEDNGCGIEPEKINKIFEPFITTKATGTGLGLAISRKMCIENDAVLSVECLEKGSRFIITKEIINE